MTAVPLADVAELNEPQVPAGAQLQVTPAFAESLATVAVIGVVSPTNRAVGVVLSVTEMGVTGVTCVLELLHATRAAIMLKLTRRRIDLRNVIVCLRSFQPWRSFCFSRLEPRDRGR